MSLLKLGDAVWFLWDACKCKYGNKQEFR